MWHSVINGILIMILSLFICELDWIQLCFGIEGQQTVERDVHIWTLTSSNPDAFQHSSGNVFFYFVFSVIAAFICAKHSHKSMWLLWPVLSVLFVLFSICDWEHHNNNLQTTRLEWSFYCCKNIWLDLSYSSIGSFAFFLFISVLKRFLHLIYK